MAPNPQGDAFPLTRHSVVAAAQGPDPEERSRAARLMQEAVVLARLEHPGIVPVHDAGTRADGRTFYCMKHVEGQTLDHYARKLPLRERLRLFQRIAEPLAFAHSRSIIHRDLKPANVMVGPFGEVLIMDWGLAKVMAAGAPSWTGQAPQHIIETDELSSSAKQVSGHEFTRAVQDSFRIWGLIAPENATAHGTILGTPGYMAPEQERGEVNLIDQRTDIFAMGSILLSLLLEPPGSPESESHSRPLRAICAKAMSAQMSARYPYRAGFGGRRGQIS